MVPSLLAPEVQRDAAPAKRIGCAQCGEKVQPEPQRERERPLCADCALDNLPFTD